MLAIMQENLPRLWRGDAMRELAAQFVALAEQQTTTAPQMVAHRLMGMSFLHTGEIEEGRVHLDRAIALYNPQTSSAGDAISTIREWQFCTHFHSGNYATANAQLDEAILLADEKGALFWKAWATMQRGCVLALTGKPSHAVHTINSKSLRGD